MKILIVTRKSDNRQFTKTFPTKKEMQRWQANNYTQYTW